MARWPPRRGRAGVRPLCARTRQRCRKRCNHYASPVPHTGCPAPLPVLCRPAGRGRGTRRPGARRPAAGWQRACTRSRTGSRLPPRRGRAAARQRTASHSRIRGCDVGFLRALLRLRPHSMGPSKTTSSLAVQALMWHRTPAALTHHELACAGEDHACQGTGRLPFVCAAAGHVAVSRVGVRFCRTAVGRSIVKRGFRKREVRTRACLR